MTETAEYNTPESFANGIVHGLRQQLKAEGIEELTNETTWYAVLNITDTVANLMAKHFAANTPEQSYTAYTSFFFRRFAAELATLEKLTNDDIISATLKTTKDCVIELLTPDEG